ncbi:MAG: cysteine desulfurase family protein [Clostridiaceae bacterium]|nr:cysteine desulfurase [Eubacteriales bacterium]
MVYLDNSATTRAFDAAAQTAMRYMTGIFFNPSSAYSPAVAAERDVEGARERFARAVNATPEEILFTSGGTEGNNMAVQGALRAMRGGGRVIVSAVEHASVYECVGALSNAYEVVDAAVDRSGAVDLARLEGILTPNTLLVSVMQVNNEVGAINDMEAIYRLVKRKAPQAVVHCDGVQGFLKVPFDAKNADLYTVSAHKFHGPKGVGALYVKKTVRFAGGQVGGGQEKNLRSGTLNTPGIMGMDAAMQLYMKDLARFRDSMYACKRRLYNRLSALPQVVFNGPDVERGAPHILNASFLGVRGEVLLHALEAQEIYVSTGAACSAHKAGKNRVLTAMGVTGERQEGAIRFSLCPMTTLDEIDEAANAIGALLPTLRRYARR